MNSHKTNSVTASTHVAHSNMSVAIIRTIEGDVFQFRMTDAETAAAVLPGEEVVCSKGRSAIFHRTVFNVE